MYRLSCSKKRLIYASFRPLVRWKSTLATVAPIKLMIRTDTSIQRSFFAFLFLEGDSLAQTVLLAIRACTSELAIPFQLKLVRKDFLEARS